MPDVSVELKTWYVIKIKSTPLKRGPRLFKSVHAACPPTCVISEHGALPVPSRMRQFLFRLLLKSQSEGLTVEMNYIHHLGEKKSCLLRRTHVFKVLGSDLVLSNKRKQSVKLCYCHYDSGRCLLVGKTKKGDHSQSRSTEINLIL